MVKANLLKNIALFKRLNDQELDKLSKIINIKKVKKSDYLFKKGEKRKEFYIIVSGQIKLSQSNVKSEEGWSILKENDFISAHALLDSSTKHQQTAIIMEDSEVLAIKGEEYKTLINRNEHISNVISNELISGLNERLRHSTNKLVALYKTGQIVASEEKLADIAEETLKVIVSIIKIQKAIFSVYDKYKDESVILATAGFDKDEDLGNKRIKVKEDKVVAEMLDKRGIFKSIDKENIILKTNYHMEEALGCPMIFDGKFVGMILLGDKTESEFSVNNEILLRLITDQIAGAVYRAQKQDEAKAEEEIRRTYISH